MENPMEYKNKEMKSSFEKTLNDLKYIDIFLYENVCVFICECVCINKQHKNKNYSRNH